MNLKKLFFDVLMLIIKGAIRLWGAEWAGTDNGEPGIQEDKEPFGNMIDKTAFFCYDE